MWEHIVRPGLSWTQVSHPRCPSTQDFDNGTVTFRIDHTQLHRIAVQFEWAEPFGELQKNQKIGHFLGMSVFAQKKMCAFQRSSEHVVIRQVAPLSRIGARLMFGPPGHATTSPRVLRGPDGRSAARRRLGPADFHRRPPVWAARNSYWRQPMLL